MQNNIQSNSAVLCATGSDVATPATVNISEVEAPQSGFYVYGSNTPTELVIDSGSEEVASSVVIFSFNSTPFLHLSVDGKSVQQDDSA